MYRFLKSSQKGAMQFAKSRARLNSTDRETTTFKDVAGCDEAKEEVKEQNALAKDKGGKEAKTRKPKIGRAHV